MNENAGFVHLRVHSEYSVVDGLVRVKALTEKTAVFSVSALTLTLSLIHISEPTRPY